MVKDAKNGAKMLILALACLASIATLRAESTPYDTITNRNIFGLTTQEPPPCDCGPTKPATDVKLVGITTIFGMKQALLTVNAPMPDGKLAPHSITLAEGQQFGGVEVLGINPAARSVKVRKDSLESTIYLAAADSKK
jgi:hypothetical protein